MVFFFFLVTTLIRVLTTFVFIIVKPNLSTFTTPSSEEKSVEDDGLPSNSFNFFPYANSGDYFRPRRLPKPHLCLRSMALGRRNSCSSASSLWWLRGLEESTDHDDAFIISSSKRQRWWLLRPCSLQWLLRHRVSSFPHPSGNKPKQISLSL